MYEESWALRTMIRNLVVLLTGLLLAWYPVSSRAFSTDDILFYHSFDYGASADIARGAGTPDNRPDPLLVEGILGRGLSVGLQEEHDLVFPVAGNLDATEGTLAFWILPVGWDPNGIMKTSPQYLNLGGKGVSILVYTWSVDNDTKFLMQRAGGADTASLINRRWTPGWNHVAITWRKDEMSTYHNGERLSTKSAGSFTLPEQFTGQMRIGRYLQGKGEGPSSVLDDLYIFKRALSGNEINVLYAKGRMAEQERQTVLQAGKVTPTLDGRLRQEEWLQGGVINGLIDRFQGLIDDDPTNILVGHDARCLYVAMHYPVPARVREQPVFYPNGAFKDDARGRDAGVLHDDCLLFSLKGGDGAQYDFGINAAMALYDARDGDPAWNGAMQGYGKADTKSWDFEVAIPWEAIGFTAPPSQLSFNVRRNWRMLKSTICEWVPGPIDQSFATVQLAPGVPARVWNFSPLASGQVAVKATVPDGTLSVKAADFNNTVRVEQQAAVEHAFTQPMQGLAEVTLTDAEGTVVFARNIPFARMPASQCVLYNYPGADLLVVAVDTLGLPREGLSATVSLVNEQGKVAASSEITAFSGTKEECRLDVKPVPVGKYTVRVTMQQAGKPSGTTEVPFERKPLPAWVHSKAGIIDTVPPPWTDMSVGTAGKTTTIRCWGRDFRFVDTLLPAQITAVGGDLLAGPMRLRVTTGGQERVITTGTLTITERTVRRVSFTSEGELAPGCPIRIAGWVEYDGLLWLDLTLGGKTPASVERVMLEVPMNPAHTTLIYNGSYSGQGTGLLGAETQLIGSSHWVGDGNRGIQLVWPSYKGWVYDGVQGQCDLVPGPRETLMRLRLIDKPFTFTQPRTITLGFHPTPVRPLARDYPLWRFATEEGNRNNKDPYKYFQLGGWGWAYPNYPTPKQVVDGQVKTEEQVAQLAKSMRDWQINGLNGINCLYMFGPWAWIGSPEYADWRHEWAHAMSGTVDPDPKAVDAWGPACHNSTFNDLVAHLLEETVKQYPVWGLYFDCTGVSSCANPFHGCGYIDDQGVRQSEAQILGTRRYYERIYTIMKTAYPNSHINIHESGCPLMAIYSFCDSFTEGEQFATGLRSRKGTKPEEINYYDYVTLPFFRAQFAGHNFGVPVAFLPEFSPASGNSPESRSYWYGEGREVVYAGDIPPGHEHEAFAGHAAVEHLVGMAFVHDARLWMTYAIPLSYNALLRLQDEFGWSADVVFLPYWDNEAYLTVEGRVPEKVETSLYRKDGKVLIVPFNDTDAPVTLTFRLNLDKLGVRNPAPTVKDIYRWQQFEMPISGGGKAIYIGSKDSYTLNGNALTVTVPPRSFRTLCVESEE
jgi:hypothetical protein